MTGLGAVGEGRGRLRVPLRKGKIRGFWGETGAGAGGGILGQGGAEEAKCGCWWSGNGRLG